MELLGLGIKEVYKEAIPIRQEFKNRFPKGSLSVLFEDVVGDISDLLNSEILLAEEISNKPSDEDDRIKNWTFYKLSTIKGSVTVRWYGESNGYYGTGVDISEKEEED